VFGQAANFRTTTQLNSLSGNNTVGGALANIIGSGTGNLDVIGIIFEVGNIVIFIVTIVLGLKYIYSGVEGRADIKSSLPTYVIGVAFFYLAEAINGLSRNIMYNAMGTRGHLFSYLAGNIYATINTIANVCAILGIVLLGLKYMLSPAETRADVKKQLIPVALGLVLVYCTFKVITLVYSIADGIV